MDDEERKELEEELGRIKREIIEIDAKLGNLQEEVDESGRSPVSTEQSISQNREKRHSEEFEIDDSFEEKSKKSMRGNKNPPKRRSISRTSGSELRHCEAILEELMNHQYSWPFNEPVNPEQLKIPDYFNIIKHPIDLGTISKKLRQGHYTSVNGFAEDVRRVWSNAMLYNGPHSHFYFMAKTLSDIFEKKFIKPDELGSSQSSTEPLTRKTIRELKESMKEIEHQLRLLRKRGIDWTKTPDYAAFYQPPDPKIKRLSDTRVREMSFTDRSDLSVAISTLPSEQLRGVIQTVEEEMAGVLRQDTEDIELDLDILNNICLCRIESYVKRCHKETKMIEESLSRPSSPTSAPSTSSKWKSETCP